MPTVAEALPLLARTSSLADFPLWERQLVLSAPPLVKGVAVATSAGQSAHAGRLFAWSDSIRHELLALRRFVASRTDKEAVEVLLFNLAIAPLQVSAGRGMLHLTFDWLVKSISDYIIQPDPQIGLAFDLEPDRLVRLVRSGHPALADYVPHAGTEWLGAFYYYERLRNSSPELAITVLPVCTSWILDQVVHYRRVCAGAGSPLADALDQTLRAAAAMADWALIHAAEGPDVVRLVESLEGAYNDEGLPDRARASVGTFLTGPAARLTQVSPADRAGDVLARFESELVKHERLQMRIASWGADVAGRADDLIEEIRVYRTEVTEIAGGDPLSNAYAESRLSGLLNVPLYQFITNGQVEEVIRTLAAWHGIDEHLRESSVLLLAPTLDGAFVAACEGEVLRIDRDTDERVAAITTASDAFLGIATTLSFRHDYRPRVPRRLDVPDPAEGSALEREVRAYFELDEIKERGALQGASALLPYPGDGHPLQSVMQKVLGWTRPVVASLQEPAEDRSPRRLLLWPAGTMTVGMEVEAVQAALGGAVDVFPSESLSRAAFLEAYSDPAYDVIWVISHGSYSRYTPHQASILVRDEPFGQGEAIGLPELAAADVPGERRRLLVLNVCSGGVAASLGGLNRIGLAPQLARRNQAVIAHLWPVDAMAAATFGALLAGEIGKGLSFFEAYAATLGALRDEGAAATDRTRPAAVPQAIAERLYRSSSDLSSLAWWGSAAFFE